MDQLAVTEFITISILEKNYADMIQHFTQFWQKFFRVEICLSIDVTEIKTTQGLFV